MVPSQNEVRNLQQNLNNPVFIDELKKHHDRNHPEYQCLLDQNTLVFKIRERSQNDQIKSLVKGQEMVAGKGSRRTKERKIGEVIYKV